MERVTAAAHPNLALVKYWGKIDERLNIPTNASISVALGGATTTTTVEFSPALEQDRLTFNGQPRTDETLDRVSRHLDRVRALAGIRAFARVDTRNDFPTAAGIASSASAFAALSLAASRAAGLALSNRELSILARKGSGSACRSIHGGFVEWIPGQDDQSSFAKQIAPPHYWDLWITTVILTERPKQISSSAGHSAAWSSPLFRARLQALPDTLDTVRWAIQERDLPTLILAVEREAVSMHAIAMTGRLPEAHWLSGLYYWAPGTMQIIQAVQNWRRDGLLVGFTIDAGPNIHLLCESRTMPDLRLVLVPALEALGARIITSEPGKGAWITTS